MPLNADSEAPLKKDFYIFRHGETEMNRLRKWQGQGIDLPLNATGRAQARELAGVLMPLQIEIIFSSPLKRALETAEIAASALHAPVVVDRELIEGSFGAAEGKTRDEIAALFPETSERWHNLDPDFMDACFRGGESKRQIQDRSLNALRRIASEPFRVFGISVHSAIIRYLLLSFGVRRLQIPHGRPFHFLYKDGVFTYAGEI